ncbi:MAG: SpoIIIAH-like family protein [Ruminococcaceae bacterium]|nr:SpoIIIAH-like family protein [Oscillospiraceae bacterium]
MMVLKRKQIVMATLIVMVGIAGYLNWQYEETSVDEPVSGTVQEEPVGQVQMVDGVENGDYFAACRVNRESVRAKSLEILNATINNANSSQEAKEQAQEKIMVISKNVETEGNIENLIKAKGFADAVVFIAEDSVTVTVRAQGLTAPETARIKDIVSEHAKENNIKIVEVN